MQVFGVTIETPRAAKPVWRAKIDYLSITSGEFHVPLDNANPQAPQFCTSGSVPCRAAGLTALDDGGAGDWRPMSGRSSYAYSAAHSSGARLYTGNPTAAPLLECGGAACDLLQASGELLPFIQRNAERVTRIDLAGDLPCDVLPADFVSAGFSSRFKGDGHHNSETGSTYYVGSQKSDRWAKVYRYFPPHPRADCLRVEVTLRRDSAEAAALALCTASVADVYLGAIAAFRFAHPLSPEAASPLNTRGTLPRERTASSRLRWLEKQIRPAALEAHRSGLIDLRKWLEEAEADA